MDNILKFIKTATIEDLNIIKKEIKINKRLKYLKQYHINHYNKIEKEENKTKDIKQYRKDYYISKIKINKLCKCIEPIKS